MNAVEIDGLTYTYPGAPQPTLKEISLQIEKGDFPERDLPSDRERGLPGGRWQQRLREVHFV